MLRYMSFKPWNYFTIPWDMSELQEDNYLPITVLECLFQEFMSKNKAKGYSEISSLSLDWWSLDLVLSSSSFLCDGAERCDLWGLTGS